MFRISKKYEVGDKVENIQNKNTIEYLREMDVIFPCYMVCMEKTEHIKCLFELLKKPYVGCKVMGSLTMDKVYAKIIFDKAKIKQAKYEYKKIKMNIFI